MNKILIIGATSAIAERYARLQAGKGAELFLMGRSTPRLQSIAADLRVRGAGACELAELDVNDFDRHEALLEQAWNTLGTVDVVLLAHGTLPDNEACATNATLSLREFNTNATSSILLMGRLGERLREQGHGTLAVISSVAGDRGRASNHLYGSAKAAVTTYASGLRQRLGNSGVNVLTLKPGFVDTPMTHAFRKSLLWASPETVAKGIHRAIVLRRGVAYLPAFWWPIMQVIDHVPEAVFRRLKL